MALKTKAHVPQDTVEEVTNEPVEQKEITFDDLEFEAEYVDEEELEKDADWAEDHNNPSGATQARKKISDLRESSGLSEQAFPRTVIVDKCQELGSQFISHFDKIYNKNDEGTISWEKCRTKVNTLLFVFPKGGKFPNRFWGGEDGNAEEDVNKKLWTSLFINYADPEINVKYGGRLNKLQVKGQGSSAMRYLIWNVNSSLNKFKDANDKEIKSVFTPNGLLSEDLIPEDYQGIEALKEVEGKYYMPNYTGKFDTTEYGYTKMVGKVNYASSMQSHKIGACERLRHRIL